MFDLLIVKIKIETSIYMCFYNYWKKYGEKHRSFKMGFI